MKCKFCQAELDEGQSVCPQCGADQACEPEMEETIPAAAEITEAAEASEETPESMEREEAAEPEEVGESAQQPPRKPALYKKVLAVLGGLAVLGILAGAVLYGLGIDLRPRPNDIHFRDVYVQEDAKASQASDQVVATVGDYTLTNGELQIYYQMSIVDFMNYYGNYISQTGLIPGKPLDQQIKDPETGLTWEQFFLQGSIESWQRYAVLMMRAKEDGFQMAEEIYTQLDAMHENLVKSASQSGYDSLQAMISKEMGVSATEAGYKNYMQGYYESMEYFQTVFEKIQATDQEIEDYFTAHETEYQADKITRDGGKYVDVRHILLVPESSETDADGNPVYTEEQWAACEAQAQQVLEDWKKGEATEESFGKLAGELTQDPGSKQTGGLYENVQKGQMVPEFDAWCFDTGRQDGDTGIVKTMFGYHILYYVEGRDIWKMAAGNDLMNERTEAFLQEGMERWPLTVKYKNIVLSFPGGDEARQPETHPATAPATVPVTTAPVAAE